MYISQGDLFHGMDTAFVKKVMDLTLKVSFETGDVLFKAGDTADHFYILVKGGVKLTLGETGHVVYNVSHGGETFGWSSLVGRKEYSASAECQKPTKALKVSVEALQGVLEADPANGVILYRRLAGVLGGRLIQAYKTAAGHPPRRKPIPMEQRTCPNRMLCETKEKPKGPRLAQATLGRCFDAKGLD